MILQGKNKKAFTFIELMIGITIIGIALLSLLMGYMACLNINEITRNIIIASEDCRRVIEEMKSLSVSSVSDITGRNWTSWAASNGCNSLSSELVTVAYVDSNDNPLDVTVTVSWQQKGRAQNLSMGTLISER